MTILKSDEDAADTAATLMMIMNNGPQRQNKDGRGRIIQDAG